MVLMRKTRTWYVKNFILPAVIGVAFYIFLDQSDVVKYLQVVPQKVFVSSEEAVTHKGVKFLDPNWGGFSLRKAADETPAEIDWKNSSVNLPNKTYRVKRIEGKENWVVEGTVFQMVDQTLQVTNNYPVVIDTGTPTAAAITDSVLSDGSVEFLPMVGLGDGIAGIVHLCQLRIGDMSFVHPFCACWKGHYEKRWLGMAQRQEKVIILGLETLKNFSYILFDHPADEIEFGAQQDFDPNSVEHWKRYPIEINSKIFVDMPINKNKAPVYFDSGSEAGLVVSKKQWKLISAGLTVLEKKNSRLAFPIHGYVEGEVVVESLSIGDFSISNASVYIIANNTPLGEDIFNLGVGFFQEMQVAIDFTNDNIWIKD
jgi:hypothetical protein